MIQTRLLKGKMVERGYSTKMMADALGITPQTFYSKMKKGVFDSDEISKMIELLSITNGMDIFFAKQVSNQDTEL